MRFLVDENLGPAVARWLRGLGHEVFSVYDELRGLNDDSLLQKAFVENWILITNDKDFGEKVFRELRPHKGIILLRLEDERLANKIAVLTQVLDLYSERLSNNFVVVTESQVRFARLS
jgi:predicted nuclease of predicted toxin-antitoxin system